MVLLTCLAAGCGTETVTRTLMVGTAQTVGPRTVVVPNVSGSPATDWIQAQSKIRAAGLVSVVIDESAAACSRPTFAPVIYQYPDAGARVGRGTEVTIGVCSTEETTIPATVTVPDVLGVSFIQASNRVQAVGFTAVIQHTICTSLGTVSYENPPPGTPALRGTGVTVAVCGPE